MFIKGNCFTFNYKNISMNATNSGPGTGLDLELFTGKQGKSENFNLVLSFFCNILLFLGPFNVFTEYSGIVVLIHNQTDKPIVKNGFFISTGTFTNVEISRTYHTRLGPPYSNCRKDLSLQPDDSVYFQITVASTKYSHKYCRDVFIQLNYYMRRCQCMDPSLSYKNISKICNNSNGIRCMLDLNVELNYVNLQIRLV